MLVSIFDRGCCSLIVKQFGNDIGSWNTAKCDVISIG